MTPKDFFMHLLGFFALYVSVVSFLVLFFQYINVWFPDALNFYFTGILNAIRMSSSALIVVFIVFILVSWLLERDFSNNPAKRDLKFRKWLIYFTLFVSAVTIVIDLVRLVYNFYSGDLSIKFFLKVIIVFLVAAAVFGYYFWDLKRKSDKKYKQPRLIAWLVAVLVLATIVSGFFIVGSPTTQRSRQFDDRRISDLQNIQSQIVNYWQQKEKLPEKLADLNDSISGFTVPTDPENGQAYEYNVISSQDFELCAVFKTASLANTTDTAIVKPSTPLYYVDPYQQNWEHGVGRVCFSRTIDPELYKLNPAMVR